MSWRGALLLIGLIALITALLTRTPGNGPPIRPYATLTGRVVAVVDGDTVRVRLAGVTERVRYIGMDTPESVRPGTPVECWAKRAAADNASLVAGRAVRLRLDRNPRDRYGRLLAYVFRAGDNLFVNAELVRRGDARERPFTDNTRHAALFARLAAVARLRGTGLWSHCGPSAVAAFPTG